MAIFFSGSEMLEIAKGIEQSGIAFYEELAKKIKNKDISALYRFLADEEKNHLVTFQKIADSIGSYQPPESYPGEYMLYLKSLVDNAIFKDVDAALEKAQKVSSDYDAIDIGIQSEKDSVLFYEELQNVVRKPDQKVIKNIILENPVCTERFKRPVMMERCSAVMSS